MSLGALGSWHERARHDARRDERTAALLGTALGVCFGVCFLTGVFSHLAQNPPSWFTLPARPAGLYRVTQGLHVATGIATVPLLLAKLWAVFPHLFRFPPVASAAHLVERLALLPLVGGAVFQLFSGVANMALWYPLPFFFPAAHHWVAWITIGALVIHIGAKLPVTVAALGRGDTTADAPADRAARRRFLGVVGGSAGVLTLATIGQTVFPLRHLALLAPRRPDVGDQGFPVNKTAVEAGVVESATAEDYTLTVTAGGRPTATFTLAELRALPQREATLPIACVEGWSATKQWRGVALADLLAAAGVAEPVAVTVRSLEDGGLYGQSDVNRVQAADPDTLLALEVEGEPLSLDHGFPVRLIGPNRPGVMQTKWVTEVEVR